MVRTLPLIERKSLYFGLGGFSGIGTALKALLDRNSSTIDLFRRLTYGVVVSKRFLGTSYPCD